MDKTPNAIHNHACVNHWTHFKMLAGLCFHYLTKDCTTERERKRDLFCFAAAWPGAALTPIRMTIIPTLRRIKPSPSVRIPATDLWWHLKIHITALDCHKHKTFDIMRITSLSTLAPNSNAIKSVGWKNRKQQQQLKCYIALLIVLSSNLEYQRSRHASVTS